MTDRERKAIFYKLEHEGPIVAKDWGLKPIAEPTENFTLAVPRDLDRLEAQVAKFETGALQYGMVPNAQLARLQTIALGDPKDRLSQDLFERYEGLITQDTMVCEVEMLSLAAGKTQQRNELQAIRHDLARTLGTQGTFFEHEEIKGTCRAVIRCSGDLFKQLVEAPEWQTRLTWFEAQPDFQTRSEERL